MSDTYPLTEELTRLGASAPALGVLDLVFSAPEWIHRRVEKVDIVTSSHVRRRVSLDLTVPSPCAATIEWFDGKHYTLLPIDVPAKTSLVAFDVRDEHGNPIPVLTERQNGEVAWRGMIEQAQSFISADEALPTWVVNGLRRITQRRTRDALRTVRALKRLARFDSLAAAMVQDEGFITTVEMLARNFLLIALLPATPGARRILKFGYEESIPFRSNGHEPTDQSARRQRRREAFGSSPWPEHGSWSFPVRGSCSKPGGLS